MSPRASWILLASLLAIIAALAALSGYLATRTEPPQDARKLIDALNTIDTDRNARGEALRVDVEKKKKTIADESTRQATTYERQPAELIKRLDELAREYGL